MFVHPPTQTVSGPTVSVDVKKAGVQDLGSYGFVLSWDETILTFVSVTDGLFLRSTGRNVTCPAPVIGVNSVTFGCNTTGAQPGPNGAGILATVEFGTLSLGTSLASLSGVTLTDVSGTPLSLTTNDGTITVQDDLRRHDHGALAHCNAHRHADGDANGDEDIDPDQHAARDDDAGTRHRRRWLL